MAGGPPELVSLLPGVGVGSVYIPPPPYPAPAGLGMLLLFVVALSPFWATAKALTRLDRKIQFSRIDHPVVMTVEAQAKYVGDKKGGLSKNLFLKDKKGRFYVVSALADTKIDLKVLQQRLGVGKGLRMAPEEAFAEILQVPLGSVTPFALVNESARNVSLLLDQGFKTKECCFFHPLSNDTTISLNIQDVESFLKSDGRLVAYVDLEANPPVGKDSPPDLAALVPSLAQSDTPSVKDVVEKTASLKIDGAVNSKPVSVAAKSSKVSKVPAKEKMASTASSSHSFADPENFIEEILEKASAIVLSEIKEENFKQHGDQLGTVVSNSMKTNLSLELKRLAEDHYASPSSSGFLWKLDLLLHFYNLLHLAAGSQHPLDIIAVLPPLLHIRCHCLHQQRENSKEIQGVLASSREVQESVRMTKKIKLSDLLEKPGAVGDAS
ncbi:prolyl-tRNA synthetase associated domain-containing protein 1 [Tanacetum coccineum]